MFSLEMFQMDWSLVVYHLSHLVFAYLLALPIGFGRVKETVASNDDGDGQR